MEMILSIILIVVVFSALVIIHAIAKRNTPVGRFVRIWWNLPLYVMTCIPFFGWFKYFMIVTNKEDLGLRNLADESAERSDAVASSIVAEENARRMRREAKEKAIKEEMSHRGMSDVSISRDGETVWATDKNGVHYRFNVDWN